MSLYDDISKWDKKSKQDIATIYSEHSHHSGFIDELLKFAADRDCSDGASWLIKHALEDGATLNAAQINKLCELSDLELAWQSVLHILQILPFMTVPASHKHQMMAFIRQNTEHENKFVRAWAYNGLYEIATTYDEYRDGLLVVLETAEGTEPPAVKARIRNIKKAITKNWS